MDVLRRREAAICVSDDGRTDLPAVLATTDWLYFRLRREAYDEGALARWLARAIKTGPPARGSRSSSTGTLGRVRSWRLCS